MDNRVISIQSVGRKDFDIAMSLILSGQTKIVGCRIDDEKNRLILYWGASDKMSPLPYAMKPPEAINFAWGWIEQRSIPGPEPDHDGDNQKGFHVYNEAWGHVGGEWQACVAITPIWAMYGK